jgi:hypothetical protein
MKSDDWFRTRAQELYNVDGEIEVDDNARISRGNEKGAYVEAWVWVASAKEEDGREKLSQHPRP